VEQVIRKEWMWRVRPPDPKWINVVRKKRKEKVVCGGEKYG
jgi:hypothetical protein